MSTSLLTSISKKDSKCCFCNKKIKKEEEVEIILTTTAFTAEEDDEENEVKKGDLLIDIDFVDQKVSHKACMHKAITNFN